jgi:oligopeptide/dipeptide ABC transporter ATP-binding protein
MSALSAVEHVEPAAGRASVVGSLRRRPLAVAAVVFVAALVLVSLMAPWLAPYDPRAQDLANALSGPTGHHLLGTDSLGRDVLSKILYGGRRSLLSVAEGVVVVVALGVPLGLIAGYRGGWTDQLLARLADVLLAIPAIIFVLVVLAVAPHNEDVAMLTFGVLGVPVMFRVVRSASLRVREDLYVSAARISGLSHPRIMFRHVLPRVKGPIIVQATLFGAYALLFETGLAYLGLTSDAGTPTWGGMVGEASTVIEQQRWLLVPPGVVIALTILAFAIIGDATRDALSERTQSSQTSSRARPAPSAPRSAPVRHPDGVQLLDVDDLGVVLPGETGDVQVVDAVSISVAAGETVGLVGESGSGKSVTALALLRLLPPALRMTSGSVRIEGVDVAGMSDRAFDRLRGSTLAYISQEPQAALDPTFNVGSQLVEVVRRHEDVSRPDARRRAHELLGMVELPDPERVARSRAHELSGGMAQRIAIAIALAGRPKLLIADEPTTALDVTVQAEILALLRRIQHETHMGLLLITHNWGVVADSCDRTMVMYAGHIVEESRSQDLFDRPLHPYTVGLLHSHPAMARAGAALTTMEGGVPSPGSWPVGCRFAPRCRFVAPECTGHPIPLVQQREDRTVRCVRTAEVLREVHA